MVRFRSAHDRKNGIVRCRPGSDCTTGTVGFRSANDQEKGIIGRPTIAKKGSLDPRYGSGGEPIFASEFGSLARVALYLANQIRSILQAMFVAQRRLPFRRGVTSQNFE